MGSVAADMGAERVRGMEAVEDCILEGGLVNLDRWEFVLFVLLLLVGSHEGTGGRGKPGDMASLLFG